jgi:hypothetical protein
MQKGRKYESIQQSISKSILLGLVTALVVAVLAPILILHVAPPSMIFHVVLHMVGLTIAIFLGIVSLRAYSRNTTARMLLMTVGFLTLASAEFLHLLQAGVIMRGQVMIPIVNVELSHIILLIVVSLFGLGVLKVNK